jgi:hypothetical protein
MQLKSQNIVSSQSTSQVNDALMRSQYQSRIRAMMHKSTLIWVPSYTARLERPLQADCTQAEHPKVFLLFFLTAVTFFYISTWLPTYLPTYLPPYLPTYISTYLHTYLHTYIPTYLHTYLLTYLPTIYIPTYLYIYLPTLFDIELCQGHFFFLT